MRFPDWLAMDVCTPKVAATQFIAYMSLLNLVIWYSATWQGHAIERWGYPTTLAIGAVAGLACIAVLPLMAQPRQAPGGEEAASADLADGVCHTPG